MQGPLVTAGVNPSWERSAGWPLPHAAWRALLPAHLEEAVRRQKTNGKKGRQLIFSAGGCDGMWVLSPGLRLECLSQQ